MSGRPRTPLATLIVLALTASLLLVGLAPASAAPCTAPAWQADISYARHDMVSHASREWRAKHPNQGEEPGVSSAWQDQAACEGSEPDTEPPTAPANLTVTGTTSSSVSLAWDPSTDNVGVAAYDVRSGGQVVASTASTSHTVTGLAPATTYTFTVTARDAAGNASEPSNEATATTQPSGGGVSEHVKVAYYTQWSIYRRDYLIRDVERSGPVCV